MSGLGRFGLFVHGNGRYLRKADIPDDDFDKVYLISAPYRSPVAGGFDPLPRYLVAVAFFAHGGRRPVIGRKPDGHHRDVSIRPSLQIGCDKSMSFPALSGVSADAANGPWPREATERTFLVAAVAGLPQVFATVCRSDSLNWAAHDPGASRQSDNDRISIS
jgi:hypothetical protein